MHALQMFAMHVRRASRITLHTVFRKRERIVVHSPDLRRVARGGAGGEDNRITRPKTNKFACVLRKRLCRWHRTQARTEGRLKGWWSKSASVAQKNSFSHCNMVDKFEKNNWRATPIRLRGSTQTLGGCTCSINHRSVGRGACPGFVEPSVVPERTESVLKRP